MKPQPNSPALEAHAQINDPTGSRLEKQMHLILISFFVRSTIIRKHANNNKTDENKKRGSIITVCCWMV
jgi:hypothetical protein